VAIRGSNSAIKVTESPVPVRKSWRTGVVVGITSETSRAKTFRLALAEPSSHLAGQHYVVRLTAPDGYTALRSYSVASAPDGSNEIELTVERLDTGEVSTFLHDQVVVGDSVEVRGPIGGWFVWDGFSPALLIGAGSGVVPLMSMLRLARREGRTDLLRVVVSVRTHDDLYYADELPGPETTIVYTRAAPAGTTRPAGRLSSADIGPILRSDQIAYVCGSPGFADAATDLLIELGVPTMQIRVERFGPTHDGRVWSLRR
jgi:ferredoxin-NADP reductase